MTQAKNDAPTSERVAEAVLHFARLAAAHAQHGVAWIAAEHDALTSLEPDAESLAVLAQVTELLHKDRVRVETAIEVGSRLKTARLSAVERESRSSCLPNGAPVLIAITVPERPP